MEAAPARPSATRGGAGKLEILSTGQRGTHDGRNDGTRAGADYCRALSEVREAAPTGAHVRLPPLAVPELRIDSYHR